MLLERTAKGVGEYIRIRGGRVVREVAALARPARSLGFFFFSIATSNAASLVFFIDFLFGFLLLSLLVF